MSAPAAAGTLQGISEIRRFFRTARTPVYLVSATAPASWPGVVWRESFDGVREGRRMIRLLETTAA